MTFSEYLFRMKAHALQRVDNEYDMHLQALIDRSANATEKNGKKTSYVYKNMKDFFDYEKRIEEIEGEQRKPLSETHKRMARIAKKLNS